MSTEFLKIKAENEEFRNKLLTASPEEREILIKEHAEKLEKRKIEREKERYEERKNRFIKKCNEQIQCYKSLRDARRIALETLKLFDGKVLNARLTNAIDAKLGDHVCSSIEKDYFGRQFLKVSDYNFVSCTNTTKFAISTTPGGRIDYKTTESEIEKPENWYIDFDSRIDGLEKCRDGYDKSFNAAIELDKAIKKYTSENHYMIVEFFRNENLICTSQL